MSFCKALYRLHPCHSVLPPSSREPRRQTGHSRGSGTDIPAGETPIQGTGEADSEPEAGQTEPPTRGSREGTMVLPRTRSGHRHCPPNPSLTTNHREMQHPKPISHQTLLQRFTFSPAPSLSLFAKCSSTPAPTRWLRCQLGGLGSGSCVYPASSSAPEHQRTAAERPELARSPRCELHSQQSDKGTG